MFKFVSLFTGWGLLDEGLEQAGLTCIAQVENEKNAVKYLEQRWPLTHRITDIHDAGRHNIPYAPIVVGGPPCQPVSHAGLRAGEEDPRWLWPEYFRIVRELGPRLAFMENVPGLLTPIRDSRGRVVVGAPIGRILGDLAEIGWDASWDCLPASAVGAFHERFRVFLVAYHPRERRAARRLLEECEKRKASLADRRFHSMAVATRGTAICARLDAEPSVDRLVPRTRERVAQIKGLGNGVHVDAGKWWGERLAEALQEETDELWHK